MSFNNNWPKWIKASAIKHFQTQMSGVHLHIEGGERATNTLESYAEFRTVGPNSRQLQKNYWQLDFYVNILISDKMGGSNFYRFDEAIGLAYAAFTDFNIYKFGSGQNDDKTFLNCALLDQDSLPDKIRLQQMGQLETDVKMQQATLEGHYYVKLRS